MSAPKVHWRWLRLYVNAGMSFPACYASQPMLDLDKTALPTTADRSLVTCAHCRHIMREHDKAAGVPLAPRITDDPRRTE